MINFNNATITNVYRGSTQVKKIYQGTNLVYELPYDTDAQAFITAAGLTDGTQMDAVNDLVLGLKQDGLWFETALAIYPMVGGTADSHKYNLLNPANTNAAFRLTFNGGWTHSATGAKPNGTNAWAETYIVPNATSFLSTGGFIGYYSRTQSNGNQTVEMGLADGNKSVFMAIRWTTGQEMFRAMSGSQSGPTANATTTGWWGVYRNNTTTVETRRNTTIFATDTQAFGGLSTQSIILGAYRLSGTPNYFSDRECAFAVIGNITLTSTDKTKLYNRIQTFQTTLGRQV